MGLSAAGAPKKPTPNAFQAGMTSIRPDGYDASEPRVTHLNKAVWRGYATRKRRTQVANHAESLDILLPTLGSAGDVHPPIELGLALRKRGHRATIITNPYFEEQIRESGLGFVALGTVEEAEATLADPRLWQHTRAFVCLAERIVLPNLERLYRIIEERRSPATVVAASGLCLGARVAQEKLGVPTATVHLQPAILRTLADGGRQGRFRMDGSVPRFVKRAFYWLLDNAFFDRVLAPPVNSLRERLGLQPVRGIVRGYFQSPQLVMGLFPEWFGPLQPDWPRNMHLTGFVLHDDGTRRAITPDVEEFLAAGPPPVLFTPGSAASGLREFFRESVEACRMAGFRAMLVTNFPEQLPGNLPPGVRAFAYLPFSEILPRCAAIVHPGGIGTIAQAIKAGIPHLLVPHSNDQPDNALRIERLGLGASVYPEKYRAPRVVQLLNRLLDSPEIRSRCTEFAPKVDSPAAVNKACDLLEGLSRYATPTGT